MEESDEDLGTHEDEELNEIMEFVFGGEDILVYISHHWLQLYSLHTRNDGIYSTQ